MKKEFLEFLKKNGGSTNIFFKEYDVDTGVGCSTRYGRKLFGRFAEIEATTSKNVRIIHPCVLMGEDVYQELKKAGCKTND